MSQKKELKKLSEDNLAKQPDEVFDILCKLGRGSYGCVYKALHKDSSQILAIKKVPVDTDLQEIIKEISIMQQCNSPYVVKYYGSYFKNTDLWIVMEYCGAGSVSDIIKLRKKTCAEAEIATIFADTLKGLEYLHLRRKIHRDIKAGNILLNNEGRAKLADFGVAGQLTDTMAKRNTVIGTPFWMAPEVIQEIGYDCGADIWSLGITALEMGEGKPPYSDIHPMRAIFMIPTKPPPFFKNPESWTPMFKHFVSQCLVKDPLQRYSATELLQHEFIKTAPPATSLLYMINDSIKIKETKQSQTFINTNFEEMNIRDYGTVTKLALNDSIRSNHDEPDQTLKILPKDDRLLSRENGILGSHLIDETTIKTHKTVSSIMDESLKTMIINESSSGEDENSLNNHNEEIFNTIKKTTKNPTEIPLFLERINDKEKTEKNFKYKNFEKINENTKIIPNSNNHYQLDVPYNSDPYLDNNKISYDNSGIVTTDTVSSSENSISYKNDDYSSDHLFYHDVMNNEFLAQCNNLSYCELKLKMDLLDPEMEKEIEELRSRYQSKRKPILDAIDAKKRLQQNF